MEHESADISFLCCFLSFACALGISCHHAHPTFMRVSCDANSDSPMLEWQMPLPLSYIPSSYFYFYFLSKFHTGFHNGCPNLYCYPQCKMVSFLYIHTEAFCLLFWLMEISTGVGPQRNEKERNCVQSIVSFMALLQPCWMEYCV